MAPEDLSASEGPEQNSPDLVARAMLDPYFRHGAVAADNAAKTLGWGSGAEVAAAYPASIRDRCSKTGAGDLSEASQLLLAQALTLDTIFTEFASSAARTSSIDAAERFMRLALKAQANGRATLEALTKLHQPREQIVRHIHVNEGGQAVIADEFHHHAVAGGSEQNYGGQPHATRAAGSGTTLLGQDPQGHGLPIPGSEGQRPLPNARRQGQRRTSWQPKRLEAWREVDSD